MARSTIDKRANGKYRARYFGPDRRWYSRTFDRRVDAQRWRQQQLARIDRGEWVDPNAGYRTFGEIAERWEAGQLANRPSTRERDHNYLNSLILPHLGIEPLSSISPALLEAWVAQLVADGKAPATVRKAWQIATKVLALAVRDRLIASSPAFGVELPRIEREEPLFLEWPEIEALATAIDPRYRAMVMVGGLAGLRIGEVCGLKVEDVDLLRKRLFVHRTVGVVNGSTEVGRPKTEKSVRSVALPPDLAEELEAHLAQMGDVAPNGWLFVSPKGGPIDSKNWNRRVWKPAVKAAGLPAELRFHDLRHSHVALLIAVGEHPRAIADRLGHVNVNTVLNVYGHLLDGTDEAAAERIGERIASYSRPEAMERRILSLRN
jgi:integrase